MVSCLSDSWASCVLFVCVNILLVNIMSLCTCVQFVLIFVVDFLSSLITCSAHARNGLLIYGGKLVYSLSHSLCGHLNRIQTS